MQYEFDSNLPIYIQIIEEIKRQIVYGERRPGEKIESVRELANIMGVNPNTVQRAFSELEREGLLKAERTTGRFITIDDGLIEKIKRDSVKQNVTDFIKLMYKSGFSKEGILDTLKKFLEEYGDE
ncbi:GntR family transcriptional regulator [Clostridium sp. 19966]|uniref:GntR family transcriptional regulator n=1 Tax=Clostridium sp. 19966 TaxID=2768166 RepID=UPI0028DDF212|nr:GntR family transcriptional regulator [Clostridium sp. 19966]